MYKILKYVESYQKENNLSPLPIMLCGYVEQTDVYKVFICLSISHPLGLQIFSDWNGSKRGHVYKFLRSQGFVSSYDTAHLYTDADAHKVSFRLSILSLQCPFPVHCGILFREVL